MRKVSATVIFKKSTMQLYNLTVNDKGNLTPLVQYWEDGKIEPFKYGDMRKMYESVLNILKNNNFYVGKYSEFNADWYDIQWIDIDNPLHVHKFAYVKEGK